MSSDIITKNIPKELITKVQEDLLEKDECRNIVKEIMDFGVSQRQIIEIINILALELENREQMISIRNATKKIKGDSLIIGKVD
ncbi:hypothetical protein CMI47_12720 [Candidatus Pacearchaeota archaeon]|nr:hypothetical protein [Candidatus Pacearchaeota archaeon]|tara:strand:+ start:407 stop:658 length:252 start_codon:yes stop_codon:yes gene_type:complete